jgi:tRNA modification GTPase
LLERERAIVTASPGTTRDLVTDRLSLGGIPVELVDTAGLREAKSEAEAIGIRKSREALAEADVVMVVLDASVPLREDERELIASLEGRRAMVVRNKADLNTGADVAPELPLPFVTTSALSGDGVQTLRDALAESVRNPAGESESGILTSLRHFEAVSGAVAGLDKARDAVAEKTPHEMLLLDLYAALRQLDGLTGETTAEDILNRIFSTFCIGK